MAFITIVDQVANSLSKKVGITVNSHAGARRDHESSVLVFGQWSVKVCDIDRQISQIHVAKSRSTHVLIDSCETQEGIEDTDEPIELFPNAWVTLPGESRPDGDFTAACSKLVLEPSVKNSKAS